MKVYGYRKDKRRNPSGLCVLPFVHASGMLKKGNSYNMVGLMPKDIEGILKLDDGIYDVEFYNAPTEPVKAKLYLWRNEFGRQYGDVCAKEDLDGCRRAMLRMELCRGKKYRKDYRVIKEWHVVLEYTSYDGVPYQWIHKFNDVVSAWDFYKYQLPTPEQITHKPKASWVYHNY